MSIESEIRDLEKEQRKYRRYSTQWKKIEDKKDELKRKRKRYENDNDDNGDIAILTTGILDSLSNSGSSYSDSSSSVDFGGGDSGGGGFGGDF